VEFETITILELPTYEIVSNPHLTSREIKGELASDPPSANAWIENL
jgi:hypothetical protein